MNCFPVTTYLLFPSHVTRLSLMASNLAASMNGVIVGEAVLLQISSAIMVSKCSTRFNQGNTHTLYVFVLISAIVNETLSNRTRIDTSISQLIFHIVLSWVIKQLFHTLLCNSKTYYPRGAMDDPLHYCPLALGNSASGHQQPLGANSFYCCTKSYEIAVYCFDTKE